MIAAAFGGKTRLEDPVAKRGRDPDTAIRHFNDQLPLIQADQHLDRIVRPFGALGGFDGVIQ